MTSPHTIVLVDDQDNAIGSTEKTTAHQQGLLHRAFSVFVFNDQKQLLLQQRHPDKYHCGGLWTNTCCSHPEPGEPVIAAGERRLQEELGFTVPLTYVGEFIYRAEFNNGLTEHEYDHVLVGHFNGPVTEVNPEEIAKVKWVDLPTLQQGLTTHPELYTPWFGLALNKIL